MKRVLRPILKRVLKLPDHFAIGLQIGLKITSKNVPITDGFWVELSQILRFGFSV